MKIHSSCVKKIHLKKFNEILNFFISTSENTNVQKLKVKKRDTNLKSNYEKNTSYAKNNMNI